MSEMIERVARASFACWRARMDELGHHMDRGRTFEDMSNSEREFALMNARAVIAEMRKPTPQMLQAAELEDPHDFGGIGYTECWCAMIDAALK